MTELKQIASNFTRVTTNDATLYFSYETCIAFEIKGELIISKNVWSNTTGKHLNLIDDDKSIRIDYNSFKIEIVKRELTKI